MLSLNPVFSLQTVVWPAGVESLLQLSGYPPEFTRLLGSMMAHSPTERPWLAECIAAIDAMVTPEDVIEGRLRDKIDSLQVWYASVSVRRFLCSTVWEKGGLLVRKYCFALAVVGTFHWGEWGLCRLLR